MWRKPDYILSKFLIAIAIIGTIWIWLFMGFKKIDLVLSCLTLIIITMSLISVLSKAILPLRSRMICFAISNGFWTTFIFTSMIAGDWDTNDRIAHVCWGQTHLHHWAVYGLILIFFRCIPVRQEQIEKRTQWAYWGHAISGILLLLSALSMAGVPGFNGNRSFSIQFVIIAFVIGCHAFIIQRSRELSSRWFHIILASTSGVILAIFLNGMVTIMRDYLARDHIPSSFIFFNETQGCPVTP